MTTSRNNQLPALNANRNENARSPLVRAAFWLTLAFAWLLGARMGLDVWRSGYFVDTDDAMRMVQVRDFIAGQGWFDLVAKRLGDPPGLMMHWTRVADLPVAFLIWIFSFVLDAQGAERAARLLVPGIWLAILFLTMRALASRLLPPVGVAASLVICAFSGLGATQFTPGRIDHHAMQIVLLVSIVFFSLKATKPGNAPAAAIAAALMSLSLAISIENLPFIAAGFALWPLLYVHSARYAQTLAIAGVAGLVTLPIALGAFTAPSSWTIAHCDAFSPTYLAPMMAACLFFIVLGTAGQAFSKLHRITGVIAGGAISILIFTIWFPECLKGPLHTVDPFLRDYWLNNVAEARGFFASLRFTPEDAISTFAPLFAGVLFCLAAALKETGEQKLRWLAVLLFATAGLAASIWQIRAASSLAPIAALGGGWAAAQLFDTLTRRKVNFASIYALSFSLLFSVMIWNFLTKSLFRQAPSAVHETGEYTKSTQSIAAGQTCFRSEIYTALSALPAGLVLAPIDSGAHILAHGPHRVLAAAYHRNNAGNHQAIKILLGDLQQARHSIISAGVDYIALCNGGSEMRLLQLRAPNGFAAQLQRGSVPDWLEKLSAPDQQLLIFKVINR